MLADLIDTLFDDYGISALGLDLVVAEPEHTPALRSLAQWADAGDLPPALFERLMAALDGDQALARALQDRRVVAGFVFNQARTLRLNTLPTPHLRLTEFNTPLLATPQPMGYTTNIPEVSAAAHSAGFFDNPAVDSDGLYRRATVVQQMANGLYFGLSVQLLRSALNDLPVSIRTVRRGDDQLLTHLQLGSLLVPLSPNGSVRIPYLGPKGRFRYVSAAAVLAGETPLGTLSDRIVLLGTTAPGLQDIRATPVDSLMPGVEIHANVMSGILDQRIPVAPDWAMAAELVQLVIAGGLVLWALQALSPLLSLLAVAGLSLLTLGLNLLLWQRGFILPIAATLVLILALYLLNSTWGLLVENQSRRRLARTFGQYVPPELVNELANQPELATTAGTAREMTVLFSDVQGFTPISENLEPEQLSQLMNRLLTRQYDVDILVSEATRNQADAFEFREIDRTLVKGKTEPVRIFTPEGRRAPGADQI